MNGMVQAKTAWYAAAAGPAARWWARMAPNSAAPQAPPVDLKKLRAPVAVPRWRGLRLRLATRRRTGHRDAVASRDGYQQMNVLTPWANYFVAQAGAAGALVCLWPARTASPPGWTTTALAALAAVTVTRIVLRRPGQPTAGTPGEQASRLVITLTEPAATVIGSALVATGHAAGAFVQASGALAELAVGLVTAWILLVEVRRTRPVAGPSHQ
jgi:hypothetical protein